MLSFQPYLDSRFLLLPDELQQFLQRGNHLYLQHQILRRGMLGKVVLIRPSHYHPFQIRRPLFPISATRKLNSQLKPTTYGHLILTNHSVKFGYTSVQLYTKALFGGLDYHADIQL